MNIVKNYEYLYKPVIWKFPLTLLQPNQEVTIFNFSNISGRIIQISYEVIANNNNDWQNTLLKFYVNNRQASAVNCGIWILANINY